MSRREEVSPEKAGGFKVKMFSPVTLVYLSMNVKIVDNKHGNVSFLFQAMTREAVLNVISFLADM